VDRFVALLHEIQAAPRRVIELGCGDGAVGLELERRRFEVLGIDFSAEGLKWARKRAAELHSANTFRQVDLSQPLVPADELLCGTFESAVDARCLHCIALPDSRRQALQNVHRLLAPNGTFFVASMVGDPPAEFQPRFEVTTRSLLDSERRPYRHIATQQSLEQELGNAGFRLLARRHVPRQTEAEFDDVYLLAERLS
jgi:SAM-dependent methyltransferase